jgi:hypothetical protein
LDTEEEEEGVRSCFGSFSSSPRLLVYQTTIIDRSTEDLSTTTFGDGYHATTRTSQVNTSISVDFGYFQAEVFQAVFRQGEIPEQTSMSSNTGGEVVYPFTNIPSPSLRPSSGFSERAAAGIGVGAALGVLSLSSFGFFLYRRRSRLQKRQQQGTIEEPSDEYRAELHNEHKVEMHDETVAAKELDTPDKLDCVVIDSAEPVELDVPVEVEVPEKMETPEGMDAPAELDTEERLDLAGEILKEQP